MSARVVGQRIGIRQESGENRAAGRLNRKEIPPDHSSGQAGETVSETEFRLAIWEATSDRVRIRFVARA